MHQPTPLDIAFLAIDTEADPDRARLAFHECLLDTELFLLLETEPEGDGLAPRIFDIEDGRFALAFDRADRLAAFLDGPEPYAAITGRSLAEMFAGQGIGVALNPGDHPSATLLPAATFDWLASQRTVLTPRAAAPAGFSAPRDVPEGLLATLARKLATMAMLIDAAWLVSARHEDGPAPLLVLTGVPGDRSDAVAAAIAEALRFGGFETPLDIAFLPAAAPALAAVIREGHAFDLPRPVPGSAAPKPPGSDPDRPPILRRGQ